MPASLSQAGRLSCSAGCRTLVLRWLDSHARRRLLSPSALMPTLAAPGSAEGAWMHSLCEMAALRANAATMAARWRAPALLRPAHHTPRNPWRCPSLSRAPACLACVCGAWRPGAPRLGKHRSTPSRQRRSRKAARVRPTERPHAQTQHVAPCDAAPLSARGRHTHGALSAHHAGLW